MLEIHLLIQYNVSGCRNSPVSQEKMPGSSSSARSSFPMRLSIDTTDVDTARHIYDFTSSVRPRRATCEQSEDLVDSKSACLVRQRFEPLRYSAGQNADNTIHGSCSSLQHTMAAAQNVTYGMAQYSDAASTRTQDIWLVQGWALHTHSGRTYRLEACECVFRYLSRQCKLPATASLFRGQLAQAGPHRMVLILGPATWFANRTSHRPASRDSPCQTLPPCSAGSF